MLKTPPLQTATATIDTLCARLQSATLLEDRRAAILGLRSFAKQYPASVASGSVRELITTLRRDGLGETANGLGAGKSSKKTEGSNEDVDTIRLVLETILMLFNPDADSPEAGDELAFFMADEFSVRQDNILLLLSLLDPTGPHADYYSRKYSIDILSAICAARPERLRECILTAPLGVSRVVSVLDDGRDAVRNAGLLLLVDLTDGASEDLRKIVAFEDVFSKIFALIQLEGGLAESGIIAQDCLTLLANLIKGSSSNQKMFRESGCIQPITQLLLEAFPSRTSEAAFIAQSREKSAFGLLQLLRFFFTPGEMSTPQNQSSFFRTGAAQILIDLGFSSGLAVPIRRASLLCAADLIAQNAPLQEQFAGLTVESMVDREMKTPAGSSVNGTRSSTPLPGQLGEKASAEAPRTYIIEALLDLALERREDDSMLRAAAYDLIQAYLVKHDQIRAHFLQRAITGHIQHETAANVLTSLTQSSSDMQSLILASSIVQDLIAGDLEAKTQLASLREGNEGEGEDVLSFIQTLGSRLLEVMKQDADTGPVASYTSLLTTFLWNFAQGVDDFLAEGSGLLQELANLHRSTKIDPLIAGLSSVLLGTVYEFSTKDSPIPRRTLAPLLTQNLTRAKYLDSLTQLRKQPAVRDYEFVVHEDGENILCSTYVELFTVEYSRLRKAIDKDPGLEVLPPSANEAGVDRDVLDDLRQQLQSSKDALATAQEEKVADDQQHEQELLSAQKDHQTSIAEVNRLRRINEAMQQGHESELEKLEKNYKQNAQDALVRHQQDLTTIRQEAQYSTRQAVQQTETSFNERIREYERRMAELGNTHRAEQAAHDKTRQQYEVLAAKHNELTSREATVSKQHAELTQQHSKLQREHEMIRTTSAQAQSQLSRLQKDLDARNAEVERLATQTSELQEEVRSKDAELATERAGFEDLEKELEKAKIDLVQAQKQKTTTGDNNKLALLEKQLEEATSEKQSAKDELETMLMVMADIESKRDAYRAKVQKLGGEVSDEDEDEAGEEDEEGPDDDEESADEDDVD